nr:hypothetical protein BaRGS_015108 [Batillaria attramentaria]
MIAVFFAKSGHVATVPLLERKTVNAEWYINTCLPKVFEAWSARRPRTVEVTDFYTQLVCDIIIIIIITVIVLVIITKIILIFVVVIIIVEIIIVVIIIVIIIDHCRRLAYDMRQAMGTRLLIMARASIRGNANTG